MVENGQHAVDFYKEAHLFDEKIDFISMDLQMPVMDGKEAMKQIRMYEKENYLDPCHIIVISGNCIDDEVRACLDPHGPIQADGFLRKPVKKSEFEEYFNSYVKQKHIKNNDFPSRRCLIIDDDIVNYNHLRNILKKYNITSEYHSLNDAMVIYSSFDHDMIFINFTYNREKAQLLVDEINENSVNNTNITNIYGIFNQYQPEIGTLMGTIGLKAAFTAPFTGKDLFSALF
jgi:CheY-like chemotaxis protein